MYVALPAMTPYAVVVWILILVLSMSYRREDSVWYARRCKAILKL